MFAMLAEFPSLIRFMTATVSGPGGRTAIRTRAEVDIPTARWLARRLALADDLFFIRLLEAVCKGLNYGSK